jgi:hypothetical protein
VTDVLPGLEVSVVLGLGFSYLIGIAPFFPRKEVRTKPGTVQHVRTPDGNVLGLVVWCGLKTNVLRFSKIAAKLGCH